MTENLCVRCGRPTPDGYADVTCGVERPRAWLTEIADMVPAARDVAQRQARRGGGGGASGKPGSSLPIDLAATSRLDAVQNELATWVRHVAEERGVNRLEINGGGLTVAFRGSVWVDQVQGLTDDLGAMALWLADHCEWMRHRPELDEWLTDVEACARVVRGIARGPAAQRYLGPCGAHLLAEVHPEDTVFGVSAEYETRICEGDVYGSHGGQRGTCRTCGAQVEQAERKAWLDDQVADRAYRAAHIADAYRINVNTIRSWALRGLLPSYWSTEDGLITPWIDPVLDPKLTGEATRRRLGEISDETRARGGRLHYVGDVLELAREAAARRAENEAKKALREAA